MLALEEKVRTVVVLESDLNDVQGEEIFSKFKAVYLDIRAHKQVFLTNADSDSFFAHLPKAERITGLVQVVVLENLEGDVIVEATKLVQALQADFPGRGSYCSQGSWDAVRDLEYFFPHLGELALERTLALIKPDGLARGSIEGQTLEEVVEAKVAEAGLLVVGKRRVVLKPAEAQELCKSSEGSADYQGAVGVLLAEPGCIAMCLEGPGAAGKWNLICGPSNCGVARERAPHTLRAKWGTDSTSNALHASDSMATAEDELALLFPEDTLELQRTLCIVKPDAMATLPQIRQVIEEKGFTVLAEKQTILTEERARDFYRDCKDKPFYNALVKHASSGPCCLLALCRLEAVSVLQQVMGPEIVTDARRNRPSSLRAQFGRDGQRNAVHGSTSSKNAVREVRFFFPELGSDTVPDDDEVRDFLFRKGTEVSMDLRLLEDTHNLDSLDTTFQQFLSKGLMALCQVQPKGLGAVKWLSRWLMENKPSQSSAQPSFDFAPDDRTKRVIEHGINQDGLPFVVEAPPAPKRKQVIEVDVSQEASEQRTSSFTAPPFVVFLCGGPGAGKSTQCARLRDDFNLVHLSIADIMRQEVAAKSFLGTEVFKNMQQGTAVPDSVMLQLLKKTMVKHQDTNRFILDGFPCSVEQAKLFEQEIAEFAFGISFEAAPDLMRKRVAERAAKTPGRVDDNPETVDKGIRIFQDQAVPIIEYYYPIGKIRTVQCETATEEEGAKAEKSVEEIYAECKRFMGCRFLYLLGPPGAPINEVGNRLETQYGYSSIDFNGLLKSYMDAGGKDSASVAAAIAKGKPVDASIACPLVLSAIYRDMALGIQNFAICNFPQSTQQTDFLEYRIPPSAARALLLDFTRADAEDLATFLPRSGDALDIEIKINTLFGKDMNNMLNTFGSSLVRVPCSLGDLETHEQLAEAAWKGVRDKVMPGVTIVLGLPGSGREALAKHLAGLTPNTYAVDCDQLLDKELERRTELGLTMHNMLARGQVVPLSMTMELLKNVVNLTCSDNLVLLNCPMYVDQLEYLAKDFRIDRVFYISGDEKAVADWREQFCQQSELEAASAAKVFNESVDRLDPIVVHFSRLGKLEQFDVIETPKPQLLAHMVEQATMPQFAIINGVSVKTTGMHADLLAAAYGVGPALTAASLEKWAKEKLKRTVDSTDPAQMFSALKQYADSNGYPLLVLNRYPCTDKDAAAFHNYFGDPKVVASFNVDEEAHTELFREENPDDNTDGDELGAKLETERKQHEKTMEEFKSKCAASLISVNMAEVAAANTTSATLQMQIRSRLLPKVYVLVAPARFRGAEFSRLIANTICTARREGSKQMKLTVIDSNSIFRPGGHSSAIEDRLSKAAFTSSAPDAVPAPLWIDIFKEALQSSANPMGNFLVTDFPTPCCMKSTPTIRDQFAMLKSICTFMGVVHVKVTADAANPVLYNDGFDEWKGFDYASFDEQVRNITLVQNEPEKLNYIQVDEAKSVDDTVRTVAAEFLSFQEKAEQSLR